MKLARAGQPQDRNIFHPSGWTAVPDRTICNGCRKCEPKVNGCPVEAIGFGDDGKVTIYQEICIGCGICKTRCDKGVIKIKQTMPMRKDLHEYFLKDYNMDLKVWDKEQ
jgi:Fe-S-cluster-containing hydrogenase component 2